MLIIRKQRLDETRLAPILKELSALSLDQYTTRMNLSGIGLGLLARTQQKELLRIGDILSRHEIPWAITPILTHTEKPTLVRRITSESDGLRLKDRSGKGVAITKTSRVLAVLGGMDGRQVGRIINARQWSAQSDKPYTRSQQYRSLIQGEPVLDILVVEKDAPNGDNPTPDAHLRVFPGRFDPAGLGEAASASSRVNLDRLLRLLKEQAGDFDLDLDFGIGGLPGSIPDFSKATVTEHNLKALSSYALYAFRLRQNLPKSGGISASSPERPSSPLHALAPAAAAVLDATGLSSSIAGSDRNVELPELDYAGSDEVIARPEDAPVATLPPPPAAQVYERNSLKVLFNLVRSRPYLVGFSTALLPLFALLANVESLAETREWLAYILLGRGGAAAIVSLVSLWLCTRYFRLKRWSDNLPTSRVRSLAMGMVELSGVAERAYNLVSPVSGMTCVWFRAHYFVKSAFGGKGNQQKWKWVATRHSGNCSFYLRDDTGRVLVNPEGATLLGLHRAVYSGEFAGFMGAGPRVSANERIVEEIIPELQPLYVLGFAAPLEKPDTCLKQRTIEKLRALKADQDALMRYDLDGNGVIDADEWRQAVADVRRQTIEEAHTKRRESSGLAPRVAIMAPEERRLPFVISAGKEHELTRRYLWMSLGCFAVALASLVVAVLQLTLGSGLH